MKRTFRKLLSITLCLTMVLGNVAVGVGDLAAFAYSDGELTFQKGDIIPLGSYPQSRIDDITGLTENEDYVTVGENHYAMEPIEWVLLDPATGLSVSRYILDSKAYDNSSDAREKYSDSTIRQWLFGNDGNGQSGFGAFYAASFTNEEKTALLTKDIHTYSAGSTDNIDNSVEDSVFLLSYEDVSNTAYFENEYTLDTAGTDYACANGFSNDAHYWWLRSPSDNGSSKASYVFEFGKFTSDLPVNQSGVGVRPAVYLNLQSRQVLQSLEGSVFFQNGDVFAFGSYPQSAITDITGLTENEDYVILGNKYYGVEPIEWVVIDADTGLCVSKKVLDSMPFSSANSNSYPDSDIRAFLYGAEGTGTFYNTAFTEEEKACLLQNEIVTTYMEDDVVLNSVSDKIFLPSYEEYMSFEDSYEGYDYKIAGGTAYAAQRAGLSRINNYMLRTPHIDGNPLFVGSTGMTGNSSVSLTKKGYGIRPAAYFDLNSETILNSIGGKIGENLFTKGATISFGSYPQSEITDITGLTENKDYVTLNDKYFAIEPIEWILYDVEEGLCISKNILDASVFNSAGEAEYSDCDIRAFLYGENGTGTFYNTAFTDAEKSCLFQKDVGIQWDDYLKSAVQDKVFLPSLRQVELTFEYSEHMGATGTAYVYEKSGEEINDYWTCNESQDDGVMRTVDGEMLYNMPVVSLSGVRPAICLDLHSQTVINAMYGGSGAWHWAFNVQDYSLTISGAGEISDFEDLTDRPYDSLSSIVRTIHVQGDITRIGNRAFENFTACTQYDIQAPVTAFGTGAFMGNTSMTAFTAPSTLTEIGSSCFEGNRELAEINLPDGVLTIGDRAFYGYSHITTFIAPESLVSIGQEAFAENENLRQFIMADNVKEVKYSAFANCYNLEYIRFSYTLEDIYGYAFQNCYSLEIVRIPPQTFVGGYAFDNCTNLTIYFYGKSLNEYNYNIKAVHYWSWNTSVCGVGLVRTIEQTGCFAPDCYWDYDTATNTLTLTGVGAMPDYESSELRPWHKYADTAQKIVVIGFTRIGKNAFSGFSAVREYDIADCVTAYGEYAFSANSSLAAFTMKNTVTSVDSHAFDGCGKLSNVTFSSAMQSINDYTFYACGLQSLTIPANITTIGANAFAGANLSKGAVLSTSITAVGTNAFGGITGTLNYEGTENEWHNVAGYADCGANVMFLTLERGTCGENIAWRYTSSKILYIDGTGNMPDFADTATRPWNSYAGTATKVVITGISSIGNNAFRGFNKVTSYEIDDTVTAIGTYALNGCSSLTAVTLPEHLLSIGNNAFSSCHLQSISIPDSVTYIGNGAFACNEWTLKRAKLPKNLKVINSGTFQECYALSDVVFPEDLEEIGSNAFLFCRFTELHFPETLKTVGASAFRQARVSELVLPDGVTSIGGGAFSQNDYLTSVKLPKKLTWLVNNVFEDCDNLSSVIWPDALMNIGHHTFYKTGFTKLVIPDTVNKIEYNAFGNCAKLEKISIPDSVTVVEHDAFCNCIKLESVTLSQKLTSIQANTFSGDTALKTVNIPAGVTSIGNNAFNGCAALTGLVIPAKTTSVGTGAFTGVVNTVGYEGTSAQWATVNGIADCGISDLNCLFSIIRFDLGVAGTTPENQIIADGATVQEPSAPVSKGKQFDYWYLNEEDLAFNFNTPVSEDTVLHAKWDACNHHWVNCEIIRNATATETGEMRGTCSECGTVENITIPKLLADYPTAVTLDKTSLTLSYVDVEQLTATVYPATVTDKTVTWTTSDPRVAKVINGVVVALSPGYAVITATATDNRYAVCQASCTVHVVAVSSLSTASVDNDLNLISNIEPNLVSLNNCVQVADGYSLTYSQSLIGTGTKVDVVKNGEVSDTYTALLYGDVNGDGWYDGADAAVVKQIVNGALSKSAVGNTALKAADCNRDGVIDSADVAILEQADLLLAKVDKTASAEELQENDAYLQYVSLISQSTIGEASPGEEPTAQETSFFNKILSFLKTVWQKLISFFAVLFR